MLRPRRGVAAGLLLCLGIAGCSESGRDQADLPAPSPSSATRDGHDGQDTQAAPDARRDRTPGPDHVLQHGDLAVPENAEVIFAPFTSHGDRQLPFDPRQKSYSLVFSCAGEGRFSLANESDLGDLQRCRRGLPLHLTVATDGSPQVLRIRTTPDSTWRMVMIEGDGLGPDVGPAPGSSAPPKVRDQIPAEWTFRWFDGTVPTRFDRWVPHLVRRGAVYQHRMPPCEGGLWGHWPIEAPQHVLDRGFDVVAGRGLVVARHVTVFRSSTEAEQFVAQYRSRGFGCTRVQGRLVGSTVGTGPMRDPAAARRAGVDRFLTEVQVWRDMRGRSLGSMSGIIVVQDNVVLMVHGYDPQARPRPDLPWYADRWVAVDPRLEQQAAPIIKAL